MQINIAKIEQKKNSKVTNIVHRPNHGIAHSVRAAYNVTSLYQFMRNNTSYFLHLDNKELEKLPLMMLFSVVGRKDETGFADTHHGRKTYQSFRATSGREFFKYCYEHALDDLYNGDQDALYKDAIIVELMGYQGIQDTLMRRDESTIETFIDYVRFKENGTISKKQAIEKIKENEYTLNTLFNSSNDRNLADTKALMMNEAHGIDLVRCYHMYPNQPDGAKSIGILYAKLVQSNFFNLLETSTEDTKAIEDSFQSFYDIMRLTFDLMQATGQKTTFGFPDRKDFEDKKAA